jgi:phosphatidylserine/phosphatidylglycerophosphate/cardiolipin synthase-like enzyme
MVQPDDGAAPLLAAIDAAKRTLDLYVFRLDHREVAEALKRAVRRGVAVRALVAHTRRGGEEGLRALEKRLRQLRVRVSRSDDDLARYHGKVAVVDGRRLLVLGYNLTRRDIEHSRSFGLAIDDARPVGEARRMFDADFARRAYVPELGALVVSPFNSRAVLARIIQQARKQLLIYDKRLTDGIMIRLLEKQAASGVDVRVIGRTLRPLRHVAVARYPGRLHVRAIIQDGRRLFVGSQSLRRTELDKRREIGVVVSSAAEVGRALDVFRQDWAASEKGPDRAAVKLPPIPAPFEHRSAERRRDDR